MLFNEKKVVVTGAAGFIGSNLTDKLLDLVEIHFQEIINKRFGDLK